MDGACPGRRPVPGIAQLLGPDIAEDFGAKITANFS
jgi:hypothetical protein